MELLAHTTWVVGCVMLAWSTLASAATPPAERYTLSNGARLVVSEQHALPLVVVQLLIDAGARRDPRGQEGVANLTADLLTEGTKTRAASQISQGFDFIGASYSTSADTDYATLNLSVLRKDLDTGLNLLMDVFLHPSFPEAEVGRRREAALAQMKAEEDDPGKVAQRAFVKTAFGDGAYGHPVVGTPDAVRKITRSEIVSFYTQHYRPEGTIISVVGDVAAGDIRDRMESALRDWKKGTLEPFRYPPQDAARTGTVTINKPISQANIVLGQLGIARDNPDYYTIQVMNYILGGGGFSSRLLDNIRTKAGLAYSVASFFTVNKAPGSFQVVMQTKNASAIDAIQRACDELKRIRREPVSDEELNDAKLYLTGSFPLRLDSNTKVAGFLTQVEFFNLGDDYADTYKQRINAITKEDVQRVAQQYLHPEQMHLIVVSDLSQVQVPQTAACAGSPD
ncbi:MAG: M16 family metallopeptidase [Candidatus Binatia bacterium]